MSRNEHFMRAPEALLAIEGATALRGEKLDGRFRTGLRAGVICGRAKHAILQVDDTEQVIEDFTVPPEIWSLPEGRLFLSESLFMSSVGAEGIVLDGIDGLIWDIDLQGLSFASSGIASWFDIDLTTSESGPTSPGARAKPPAPAALKRWFEELGDRIPTSKMTKAEIWALARDAFPENFVSRDSVSNLVGPRKTGPISG